MNSYRIADAHCHIFPRKIADKAVASIGNFYGIEMLGQGLPEELVRSGGEISTERYLVCSTATVPAQVESINRYIIETCAQYPQFVGFATLHPDYPDAPAELARATAAGLRGIKLHPDFQKFNIDDPKAVEMYRHIEAAGLPILFHTGDSRYDFSAPQRLAAVAERLPGLTCIAAHFGGYSRWQDAARCLGQPNVWYDTSSTLFQLPADDAVRILRQFGADHFLFGTDYPMWNHREELARFLALLLTEEERRAILWDNFQRLFPEQ